MKIKPKLYFLYTELYAQIVPIPFIVQEMHTKSFRESIRRAVQAPLAIDETDRSQIDLPTSNLHCKC